MTQQVVHGRVLFASTQPTIDNSSMDFYVEATGSNTSLTMSEVKDHLVDFFNNVPTGGAAAPNSYMAAALDRSANVSAIHWYDVTAHLNGSSPGAPFRIDMFTLGGTAGNDLPGGCAAMCAYRADYNSDPEHSGGTRPRARDRGRFYFGPLNGGSIGANGGVLTSFCRNDLIAAMKDLFKTVNSGLVDQFNFVQWSRAAARVQNVSNVFVDHACVYQRRRADSDTDRLHPWIPVS